LSGAFLLSFQTVKEENMIKEQLIGFDAREMWLSFDEIWRPDSRETFLLRDNLVKPLSVDRHGGWQSALQKNPAWMMWWLQDDKPTSWPQSEWIFDDALTTYGQLCISPTFVREIIASASPHKEKPQWIVAITIFGDEGDIDYPFEAFLTDVRQIDPTWQFLGYDVAEEYCCISGLTNMGYRDDEKLFAREQFGSHLNEYHLFTDVEIAQAFATWSNTRDPGHGPFYPYGIYLIERLNC
jgi:hypothetical protein